MAEVFLARAQGAEGFSRLVVVKVSLPQGASDDEAVRLLREEARLQGQLNHPNVVHAYDTGVFRGRPYIVLQYVDGRDLAQVLAECRQRAQRAGDTPALPLEQALTIVAGLAAGLHGVHEQRGEDGRPLGIVHRDVSPGNVLLGFEGSVKLTDFGIARQAGQRPMTQAGLVRGTIAYMSPEQCRGETLDRRSDVFSMGSLLYELVTGRRPFQAENDYAVLRLIAEGARPEPPSRLLGEDCPPGLDELVMRALEPDRDARFPTAEEVQRAIEALARELRMTLSPVDLARLLDELFPDRALPPVDEASPPGRAQAWRRARMIGVLALTGLIAGGVMVLRRGAATGTCGDGVVQAGEACDDGNDDATDGCLPGCRVARCGDGVVRAHVEECDEGSPSESCTSGCILCTGGDARFGWDGNGHCYQRHDQAVSAEAAARRCEQGGAQLVSYQDARENEAVRVHLVKPAGKALWIGLHDAIGNRSFTWRSGEPVSYLSWASWSASTPGINPNDRCVSELDRGWDDVSCDKRLGFICEREPWRVRAEDGHAYRAVRTPLPWPEAQRACAVLGGRLAELETPEEQAFVAQRFDGVFWLGGRPVGSDVVWTDGRRAVHRPFAPGEPDRHRGSDSCQPTPTPGQPADHDFCLLLGRSGKWHDRLCCMANAFLCEIE
jgi:cysteine-rich repeat protein